MHPLGKKIYITSDSIEQNLPVGEYGYIIAHDRNPDNVFDYIVRIPKVNRHFYVADIDVEEVSVLLQQEADRIEREALIDFALATNNKELFRRIINGDADEQDQKTKQESLSAEEFIKKVNLKAWI